MMRTNIFIMMSLLLLQLAGCTRAAKDVSAKISISLPSSMNKVSAMATLQLAHVAINANGEGMKAPIVYSWDSCHDCPNPPTTPTSFQVAVPSGNARLFQILAVYKDTATNSMVFYYGDRTADLTSSDLNLDIDVLQVGQGNITSGHVSGRYFTSSTSGPTGMIDIKYNPGNGKPALIVDQGSIVNGWFSFFMLSGANLQYVLRDSGTMLWGQEMSLESSPMDPAENSGAYFDQRARLFLPVHIRVRNDGATTSYYPQESETHVWGYWGPGATGKKVCTSGLDSSPSAQYLKRYASTNLASSPSLTVSHYVNYNLSVPTKAQLTDTTTPYTYAVMQGGLSMSSSCGSYTDTATNLYTNFLKVTLPLFDGNGGDSIGGFRGIFRADTNPQNFLNITKGDPTIIAGQVLPGVESVVTGLRLFKRASATEFYMDNPNCLDLASQGFVLGSANDATIDFTGNFTLTSNITSAEANNGVAAVICPVKNGVLAPAGIFVGKWMFNSGGGGGGGPGGGGPATKVAFQNVVAATVGQCSHASLALLDSSNSPGTSTSNVVVNLAGTGTTTFYSESDYSCSGTPISSITFAPNFNWMSLNFKTMATPETNIVLTPTDAASTLTSVPATVRARSTGSVTEIRINATAQGANVGTCLPMSLSAIESSGTVITGHNGPATVTAYGATVYTDPSCSVAGAPTFASGIAPFYLKSTSAGWVSLQASATIDSLNFVANYGVGMYAANEPTHLSLSSPSPQYLYINQCMPISVTPQDDMNTTRAMPSSQIVHFSSGGGGAGNNFYTDANCQASMTNSETSISSGQNGLMVYFKPQNFGNISIYANISGNNYYLQGSQSYNIANLWMHVMAAGFNGSWYDNVCRPVTFQLMDNSTAGSGTVVPNLSGSPISVTLNSNASLSNGGLYTAADCSDAIMSSNSTSIPAGSSAGNLYMKSLVASGSYVSVFPSYSGNYSPTYQDGNTISILSFAWCPPWDGGGACPASLALSGTNVGGGVALFSPAVNVSSSMDLTITLTNSGGSSMTLNTFSISGTNAAEYAFKGGPYPGVGGTCASSLAPAASCTIVVTFTPSATGGRYATLNLNYNATNMPLSLQGTGQ